MEKTVQVLDRIIAACMVCFVLFANFSISLTQLFGYMGAGLWGIQIYLTRSWKLLETPLVWPFLLFIGACFVSVITAVDPWLSLVQSKKLFTILIFFWVMSFLGTANARESFFWWIRFLKLETFQKFRKGRSLESQGLINFLIDLLIVAGTASACYGLYQAYLTGGEFQGRLSVTGTRANLVTFAWGGMVVGSVTLSRLIFQGKNRGWHTTALLIILTSILFTYIRGAWLGLFIGLFFLLYFKKRILILVPPVLVIFALLFAPTSVANRVASVVNPEDPSTRIRVLIWKSGWEVIKDHPWTGVGFQGLRLIYDQYPDDPLLKVYGANLHNNVFQIAMEMGAVGLAAWVAIWVCYFYFLFRKIRQRPLDEQQQWVFYGSAAVVLAYLVAGTFETVFYDSEITMMVYFLMALPFVRFPDPQTQRAAGPQ